MEAPSNSKVTDGDSLNFVHNDIDKKEGMMNRMNDIVILATKIHLIWHAEDFAIAITK